MSVFRDQAFLHGVGKKRLMPVGQLARRARRRLVDETVRPLLVASDHLVPQRRTVRAADLHRLFSRATVEHRRDRKQPACLRRILLRIGIIDVGTASGAAKVTGPCGNLSD